MSRLGLPHRQCPWGKEYADENGYCKFTDGEHMHLPEEADDPETEPKIESVKLIEKVSPIAPVEKSIVPEKKKSFWRRIISF